MRYGILKELCTKINCPGGYVETITNELTALGVSELVNDGPLDFMNVRLLGKGQNGFVLKCSLEYTKDYYACKIRRFDASRNNLLKEGYMLRMANSVGVGPLLMSFSRNVIIMELITGQELIDYVTVSNMDTVVNIIKELLIQCHRLDVAGISHNEISRLKDHVLVGNNGRVYIIDFESATVKKGSNVPQVINALVMGRGREQELIRKKLGITADLEGIRALLHEYKRKPTLELLNTIMKTLNL